MIKFQNKLPPILKISVRGNSSIEITLNDFLLKRCFQRRSELNLYKLRVGRWSNIMHNNWNFYLVRPPTKTSLKTAERFFNFLPMHYWKYAQMTFTTFFNYQLCSATNEKNSEWPAGILFKKDDFAEQVKVNHFTRSKSSVRAAFNVKAVMNWKICACA